MKKYIQFTHTDLDGVACAIVAKYYFGDKLKTFFCNYSEVDETMRTVLNKLSKGGKRYTIIISDLAYSEECTDITIKLLAQHDVIIADHHKSHMWMNDVFKHKHTCVVKEGEYCGAHLLNKILHWKVGPPDGYMPGSDKRLSNFVRYVNEWDTWSWTKVPEYKANIKHNVPLLLSNAHSMLGNRQFMTDIERYLDGIPAKMFITHEHLEKTLKYQEKQFFTIAHVLSNREYRWVNTEAYGWLKFMLLQDKEHFQSIISEYAESVMEPDASFIMVVEPECASLRKNKGVDLSIIAKQFGGGGHPCAAGGVDYEGNKDKFVLKKGEEA